MCAAKLEVTELLMPKATAVWLVENTAQTFEQIAAFTGLHAIEVQALADGEIGRGIVGRNPVEQHEVSQEELDKANADNSYIMTRAKSDLPSVKIRAKGPRYTPVSKRGDKPDAISYLLKHHPEIADSKIVKLIGTTKLTIERIRERTHPNSSSIRPRHPVDLGLCSYAELEAASQKGLKAQGKTDEEILAQKSKILGNQENISSDTPRTEKQTSSTDGFDFSNFMVGSGDSSNN
jgi:hypothetical protein